MRCYDCKSWGDGDGTGIPYDAGHVNVCKDNRIAGYQHPSYGACGEPTSMIMVEETERPQVIMTRGKFGCVLFGLRNGLQPK